MTYLDEQAVTVEATPDVVWDTVVNLGGDVRFYTPRELWRVRGALDRLVGGPGFRIDGPGRPLAPGDRMDFWEVTAVRPPTRLRLRAESRLPGTASVEIGVHPQGARTRLTLRTEFEPAGLPGHAYWWATVAAHQLTFALMARRLGELASQ